MKVLIKRAMSVTIAFKTNESGVNRTQRKKANLTGKISCVTGKISFFTGHDDW